MFCMILYFMTYLYKVFDCCNIHSFLYNLQTCSGNNMRGEQDCGVPSSYLLHQQSAVVGVYKT
jgi:hypothetical protein